MTNKAESLAYLTKALTMAITAPSDDHARAAIVLVDDFAAMAFNQGATDKDIELCKKAAVCAVEYLNELEAIQ